MTQLVWSPCVYGASIRNHGSVGQKFQLSKPELHVSVMIMIDTRTLHQEEDTVTASMRFDDRSIASETRSWRAYRLDETQTGRDIHMIYTITSPSIQVAT